MKLSSIRFTIPALWLGLSMWVIASIPCEARGQAKTTLRWKFQKGDHIQYSVDAQSTTRMNLPDTGAAPANLTTIVSTTIEFTWSVEGVAEDGTAQVSQALDRVRIAMKAPGGELSEDTKTGTQKGSERSKALQEVIGARLGFRITPLGEVTEINLSDRLAKAMGGAAARGFAEERLRESVDLVALVLPRQPIGVGTQWQKRIDKSEPGFANQTKEIIYTYRGISSEANPGSQLIDAKTKLDIKSDPKGVYRMDFRYKSQDGRGSIYFDNSVGRLLGMDFNQKYEMGMTMLGKESVNPHEEHVKVTLMSGTKP